MSLSLRVNTQSFGGWQRAIVSQSIDQLASSFSVELTERFPGSPHKWELRVGDSCEVWLDDSRMITGWVEEVPIEYDAKMHRIVISGRDATGDLVDCSHAGSKTEWNGRKAIDIIDDLTEPFGIEVVVDDSASAQIQKSVKKFTTNDGDSVFEEIRRITNNKAVLPVSYGDGKLYITQAGTKKASGTIERRNVLSGAAYQSNTDRFSQYVVKGQDQSDDTFSLFTTARPKGSATDSLIARYRPIVIVADTKVDSGTCRDRADWEARRRAGDSRSWVFRVQGWTQPDGVPWPLNSLVRVRDDMLGIDGTFLINSLRFSMDQDTGTVTEIGVCYPGKYELLSSMHPIENMKGSMDKDQVVADFLAGGLGDD